ncbi:hypothetical protein HAX54_031892, partial [Datura stramonium]|nr:hypothetical protein [Datura stramonium]
MPVTHRLGIKLQVFCVSSMTHWRSTFMHQHFTGGSAGLLLQVQPSVFTHLEMAVCASGSVNRRFST